MYLFSSSVFLSAAGGWFIRTGLYIQTQGRNRKCHLFCMKQMLRFKKEKKKKKETITDKEETGIALFQEQDIPTQ